MNDWIAEITKAQRDMVRAHEAQVDAVCEMLHAGSKAVDLQDASRRMADAQWKAWTAWARLWGWTK